MATGQHADKYEEVFEEEEAPKEAQSMHRIRANSSIMQLKKILGECPRYTEAGHRTIPGVQPEPLLGNTEPVR
jgi:hypothetical protein